MQPDPQPDAGPALDLDAWHAMKALPDPFLLAWRNPWSLIPYPQVRVLILYVKADSDWAIFGRVFERIGQIVGHDLPNALRIGLDRHRSAGQVQEDLPLRGCLALLFDHR